MFSEEINQKIAGWEAELQSLTGNKYLKLHAIPVPEHPMVFDIEELVEIVSIATEIPSKVICGKGRRREVMVSRQLVYWFAYYSGLGNNRQIGEYLGNRDHSTIINGRRKVEDMLRVRDGMYVKAMTNVQALLNQKNQTHAN